MEHDFVYQGETQIVKIDNTNSDETRAESYKAEVGDKQYQLNLARVSPNCFSISFDGVSKTVHVAESDESVFVHLDGRVVEFGKVTDDTQKFSAAGLEYGAKDEIKAPMPGKVVKLLVNEGDKVEVGQPLVIVESMKMENDIKSPTNGTVKSIHFSAGDLVQPNQLIIKLKPEE